MTNFKNFEGKELAHIHARLMEETENLPPGTEISSTKKKDIKALEKELRRRLEENLTSDVIPVRPTIREILSSPKPVEEKATAPLIPFNFEVLSGMNTRLDRFKIEAFTKDEAWEKAKKKAREYPGDVNLKIS